MALNTTHASVIISSRTDGFARAHRPTTRTKINRMTTLPHQPAGRSTATWYSMVEEDDASELLPTELNTIDHPRFLAVSKDKLTVRYVGLIVASSYSRLIAPQPQPEVESVQNHAP